MATDPVTAANGIMLFIPADGMNTIQAGHRIPGTLIQPPGVAQYVGLQFGSPSNQPKRRVTALEKFLKVETKTLGAMQILIGLVHIGIGGLSYTLLFQGYLYFAALGAYPFWGGLFFIASGSVSVSTDKRFNINLMKCSLGMNITSAIMASVGIILYVLELALNPYSGRRAYLNDHQSDRLMSLGFGFSAILLLFSVLEFSITVSAVHFGFQATCCSTDPGMVVLPCTVAEDGVTLLETSSVPPAANTADSSPVM